MHTNVLSFPYPLARAGSSLSDIVCRSLPLEGRRIDSRMIADLVAPRKVGVMSRRDVRLAPVPHASQRFLV